MEAVPAEVGGVGALGRAQLRVEAIGVEVAAVGAGVVEHAVQNDADAPGVGLPAQGTEIRLRAQQGVNGPVIRRVVAVVAVGLKNGVEIQRADRQALEIVQLFGDARQRAAEKVAVGDLSVFVRQEHRLVAPVIVYPAPPHHAGDIRHGDAAETVWKNLVCHAFAEPSGGGGVLVHRQLPAGQRVLRAPAVFSQTDGAAVAPGEPEAVPAQLRRVRRGVDAGEASLRRGQGHGLVRTGELPVYQQLAGVVRLVPQGKGYRCAALGRAEGGFAGAVLRIKNRDHR